MVLMPRKSTEIESKLINDDGMNLYNTGFSAGIVAAVMIPVIETFRRKKTKEKIG